MSSKNIFLITLLICEKYTFIHVSFNENSFLHFNSIHSIFIYNIFIHINVYFTSKNIHNYPVNITFVTDCNVCNMLEFN